MKLLLGVSGSVAAYKALELTRLLVKAGVTVQVALTAGGARFVTAKAFEALSGRPVLEDLWSWREEAIGHVELAHSVDVALVAPASANLIARIAHGMADDGLTATLLSSRAPLFVAPAMETQMWSHPATQANVALLKARGAHLLGPVSGSLASGRSGEGRMLDPEAILEAVMAPKDQSLAGETVMITAGPTWESIDPVRILSNRSTGAMGIHLAEAAARRGAKVHLVLGPTHLRPKGLVGLEVHRVETALEMLKAMERHLEGVGLLIGAAAVSDFRPREVSLQKKKKQSAGASQIELLENPDLLRTIALELAEREATGSPKALIVGFAAETESLRAHAESKRQAKGCDLIAANVVGPDRGFGPGETEILLLGEDLEQRIGPASKEAVADQLMTELAETLRELRR